MKNQRKFSKINSKNNKEKNIVLIFDECTSGFRETDGGLHKNTKFILILQYLESTWKWNTNYSSFGKRDYD